MLETFLIYDTTEYNKFFNFSLTNIEYYDGILISVVYDVINVNDKILSVSLYIEVLMVI